MRLHRIAILLASFAFAGGSIAATAWYAHRIGSDAYRLSIERDVSDFFEMPTTIGRVRGRTFDSRDFLAVQIRLPGDEAVVFECDTATWLEEHDDQNFLALDRGRLILGDPVWGDQRYRRLIRPDIGAELRTLDLRGIHLSDFQLHFERDNFAIRCAGASGDIDLSNPDLGRAELSAHQLNGLHIDEGVRIRASFVPDGSIEVRDIRLTVPLLPLPVLKLDEFLGGAVTGGAFEGSVEYRMSGPDGVPEATVTGRVVDANLGELTRTVPFGPFSGSVSLRVEQARFTEKLLTQFKGRGSIEKIAFASFAPLVQMPALDGEASFVFDDVDIALGVVNRLNLSGTITDVSLEQLLNRWADGGAAGTVGVQVDNFELVGETIRSAEIHVQVIPPADGIGYIDRDLLLEATASATGYEWPDALPRRLLPERVEYVSIQARLLIRDNQLRVLGTHGRDGRAIVTIRDPIFGREVAVVKERPDAVDLGPAIRRALGEMREYRPADVREWLDRQHSP